MLEKAGVEYNGFIIVNYGEDSLEKVLEEIKGD